MLSESSDPLLTTAELADVLNMRVTSRTVARWADAGTIPTAAITPGGHRRFRLADVLEALERAA